MNYFGHAALASLKSDDPDFVLGAMVPDLAVMVGLPHLVFEHESIRLGVLFHLETDSVFHQTKVFVEHNNRVLGDFRKQGIARGPARACAHIGVEMLIDATLQGREELFVAYDRALGFRSEAALPLEPYDGQQTARLFGLCQHLKSRGRSIHVSSKSRFMERLARTLAHRIRLAPSDAELDFISTYLSEDEHVARDVPQLMRELSVLI